MTAILIVQRPVNGFMIALSGSWPQKTAIIVQSSSYMIKLSFSNWRLLEGVAERISGPGNVCHLSVTKHSAVCISEW